MLQGGAVDSTILQEDPVEEGDIRSNLLGNISTHLSSLQGFDVMALELIQNADDAGAKTIRFRITPDHLSVWNDAEFDYCGSIKTLPCSNKSGHSGKNAACDFHQITEVGFGGKLKNPDNIGRFGIGFVSVYQITDQPDILSSGQRLTLVVGQGKYRLYRHVNNGGTEFILPWARNPDSPTRIGLQCSPVTDELIVQLKDDIARTLTKSLLFLRNVTTTELLDGDKLIARCTIDRNSSHSEDAHPSSHEIIVSHEPSKVIEHWIVLEADAAPLCAQVVAQYPILERHNRKTKVTIAIRVSPDPLDTGYLYAFLPTKQPTKLPLHINADFYPASSREKVIFEGQHERAWNEMLIQAASIEVGANLEYLCQKLGHAGLWNLIDSAFSLREPNGSETPKVFASYWREIDAQLDKISSIVQTRDGRSVGAWEVTIPPPSITDPEANVFRHIGGNVLSEGLSRYSNVLTHKNRAKRLTLEHLLTHIDPHTPRFMIGRIVPKDEIKDFFIPLWNLTDRLIQDTGSLSAPRKGNILDQLKTCPVAIGNKGHLSTLSKYYDISPLLREEVEAALPEIPLLGRELSQNVNISINAQRFSFGVLVQYLTSQLSRPDGWRPSPDTAKLKRFYQLLHRLDAASPASPESLEILRKLPLWKCGNCYITAVNALLHGDFTDPLGLTQLIDNDVIDPSVRGFLEERLRVPKQTPRAFIENVVPRIFKRAEVLTPEQYKKLIVQLSNHLSLLDDPIILSLLKELPMVPTADGNWQLSVRTYFWSDHLGKVLGQDAKHLWIDVNRVPSQPSAQKFLERLGVRREPSAKDIVDRLHDISQKFRPTAEARKIAQEPFYELCSHYALWIELEDQESIDAINEISNADCLPALGNESDWFSPSELYAPYRASTFESQAHILAYQDTKRLKTEFLEAIGVSINPETRLVVDHLLHCIKSQRSFDPRPIYEALNQQALKESEQINLERLSKEPCIAISPGRFVRPGRVFWGTVRLPGYAYSLSSDWDRYKQLFSIIGVNEYPSVEDFAEILVELIEECDKTHTSLTGAKLEIYRQCLGALAFAHEEGRIQSSSIWKSLQKAPLALDLCSQPGYPDELLLLDSEWLYSFFGETLDESFSRSPADWLPLLSNLGMSRLSEMANVEIDVIEDIEKGHATYEELLHERAEPIARILHDKRRDLVEKVCDALQTISVECCKVLNVRAVVEIEGAPQFSEPKPVPTFYSVMTNTLTIRKPLAEDLWLHSFNAILHQYLSQEAMTDVAKLSMICSQIMERHDLASCHRFLDTAGIPPLQDLSDPTEHLDISEEVGLIGDQAEVDDQHQTATDDDVINGEVNIDSPADQVEDPDTESQNGDLPGVDAFPIPTKSNFSSGEVKPEGPTNPGNRSSFGHDDSRESSEKPSAATDQPSATKTSAMSTSTQRASRKGRPQHKLQRDQALGTYIYVRSGNPDDIENEDEDGEEHKYRMALEFASRTIVCKFEEERGRIPDQMGQKNPGYDIISKNLKTGETRYIEVKAINGEWNKTGVGLSRTQFTNAQNFGDEYWLYVVEFALDPYPEIAKVQPIQNPAMKAKYFFFDGGWRGLAEDTKSDPLDAFVEDARGIFGSWGKGTIKQRKVSENGSILLIVDVDGKGEKPITPRVANGYMRIFAPGEES